MSDARNAILARIGAARRADPAHAQRDRAEVEAVIAARATGPQPALGGDPVERFRSQALALASTVDEVATLDAVPAATRDYLERNALGRELACWPEFGSLDWAGAGLRAEARPAVAADRVGLTGCLCALAETGTLVLASAPGTPAATSLLPETHIAVVYRARIVLRMEQAFELLRVERGRMPRALNFVSGPSRTADIEQTVTLGAHGPYRVHLIVVHACGG